MCAFKSVMALPRICGSDISMQMLISNRLMAMATPPGYFSRKARMPSKLRGLMPVLTVSWAVILLFAVRSEPSSFDHLGELEIEKCNALGRKWRNRHISLLDFPAPEG